VKWLSTHCKVFFSLLLCSSAFYSLSSYSQTCSSYPASQGSWLASGSRYVSDISTACGDAERIAAHTGGHTGTFNRSVMVNPSVYKCYANVPNFIDDFYVGNTQQQSACADGYSLVNGMCTQPCADPCPAAGTKKNATVALSGIAGQAGIGVSMCADSGSSSCGMTCTSGIASYNDVSGQSSVYCESYTFTGSGCPANTPTAAPVSAVPTQNQATPVNNPPKSKQDCPGGSGFAEVNNVGMCLPSGTQVSGASTTQTSTGGGSVTSTSTTTVNSNGTNTTTTTTTYKDSQGNVTYSGTGTATDGINQAGVPGQGDKPNLGDAPTFDPTLPQEATFNIKAQGNPVFSTEIFQTSASCPPDITYSVMGKDLSISFSSLCAFADVIRGIILMLSALVSMRVVVTQ
jgi:hypothetical protein